MKPNDVIKIEVCEDRNVGGCYARAYQYDGQSRDIPLEDTDTENEDVRDAVRADSLVGNVNELCRVEWKKAR